MPKSFGVTTIPRPKWYCQIRLTMTRDVSGWCGCTSQRAKAKRRPVWLAPGHGYLIGTPQVAIDRLLVHRQSRENKVVEALRALKDADMPAAIAGEPPEADVADTVVIMPPSVLRPALRMLFPYSLFS